MNLHRDTLPLWNMHSVTVLLPPADAERFQRAAATARTTPDQLGRAGIMALVERIERAAVPGRLQPLPSPLTAKTSRRAAELDAMLELPAGDGVAQGIVNSLLFDLMNGDFDLLAGLDLPDHGQAEHDLRFLAERWRAEDLLERSHARARRQRKEVAS